MRQPGGLTVDMWNYANDIDFYRAWARGRRRPATPSLELTRPYHCLYVGPEGRPRLPAPPRGGARALRAT